MDGGIDILISLWAQADPQAPVDWSLERLRGSNRDRAVSRIVAVIAESNREMAFRLLDELPDGPDRMRAVTAIARAWTNAEPHAAAAWVEELERDDRLPAETALIETWVKVDPAEAAHYAAALPESPSSRTYFTAAAREWSEVDPQAAVAWATTLPGENGRRALVAAVWGWAGTDPVAAADHVSGIEDFALRQELVSAVIQSWDRTDLADASAWIEENLPDTAGRAGAYEDLAYVWLATDRVAASQWIGAMPEGPERDAAVKMLVREVSASDPEAAAAWAETLSGAALRESWKKRLNGR